LAHIAVIQPIIVYAINVSHGEVYKGICALLVLTSLFEVVYITYQLPREIEFSCKLDLDSLTLFWSSSMGKGNLY